MKQTKKTIGLFSLTGCEGCYFAILDLGFKFLEVNQHITIRNFRLFEEDIDFGTEFYDFAFIEGSPITKANIIKLKNIRKHCKTLIALGSCAHLGGIYHLKNYTDKKKIFSYIYNDIKGIDNEDIKPLSSFVKVDYNLPGCPINAQEFLAFVNQIVLDKKPNITQNPVCLECQTRGYECVLQKGQVCLGPITQGGCEAICLKSKQGCWGCRGLVEDASVDNLVKKLRENYSDQEIVKYFEVFGIKELINK